MGVMDANDLGRHLGHEICIVEYGSDRGQTANLSVECETCCDVLLDADNPEYWGKDNVEEAYKERYKTIEPHVEHDVEVARNKDGGYSIRCNTCGCDLLSYS